MAKKKNDNFTIDISDPKLDNAQYLMLLMRNKLSVDSTKSMMNEKFGAVLGFYENEKGEYQIYIGGNPTITRNNGELIDSPEKLKPFLMKEMEQELHYSNLAYIQIVNVNDKNKFYGVFYSVADAIKAVNESV